MIKLINSNAPTIIENHLSIRLTLRDAVPGNFEILFYGINEVNIPCLYVDENTNHIDLDLFSDGLYTVILSTDMENILFSQDFNGSLESLIRIFLIDKKMMQSKKHQNKVIKLKLNPEKRMEFDKIKRGIEILKSSDINALKNSMYKGVLTPLFEKLLEKTNKSISQIYKDKTLVICDTHNIYHRLHHAVDPIINSKGLNMSLVEAFRRFLPNLFNMNPDFILFTDEGENNIRKKMYEHYKSNRLERDKDLIESINVCNNIIKALGFQVASSVDFEADDIIASYTKEFLKYGGKVIIFSTDKDLYQLLADKNVSMYNHFKRMFVTEEMIDKKFPGLKPFQIRDALALQGDTSDNIPGVSGIGPVSSAKLLNEYGDIDNLIKSFPNLKKSKMKDNLISQVDILKISRELTTLYDCLAQDKEFESLRVPSNLILNPTIVEDITNDAIK